VVCDFLLLPIFFRRLVTHPLTLEGDVPRLEDLKLKLLSGSCARSFQRINVRAVRPGE